MPRDINDTVGMNVGGAESQVRSLLHRAEEAIRASRPREQIVRLLEQIVSAAPDGSAPSQFARLHLAEFVLEESPWHAALHLRRVTRHDPDNDAAQALLGLCHALLGNFRMAVAAYRRAVALAPGNPWYNHNLGHLLDIALEAPHDALPYLRRANRVAPEQDEVAASLAHCLGATKACSEALAIVEILLRRSPHDPHHHTLRGWLSQGAPERADFAVPGLLSNLSPSAVSTERSRSMPARRTPRTAPPDTVSTVEQHLATAAALTHRAEERLSRARTLWRDYFIAAKPLTARPSVLAAAIDYALGKIDGETITQKDTAALHGVSVAALRERYAALRSVLALRHADPRYRGSSPRA